MGAGSDLITGSHEVVTRGKDIITFLNMRRKMGGFSTQEETVHQRRPMVFKDLDVSQ